MTTKTQKTMMSTTIAFFLALLLSTTNIAVAGLDPVVLNDLDGEIGKTMPPVDLKSQNAIHHPANEHRGEVPKILQKSKKEIIPHEEGVRFLEENANDPNVVALPSGVQYKILRHGLGMYHPLPFSLCKIHYGTCTLPSHSCFVMIITLTFVSKSRYRYRGSFKRWRKI